MISPGNPWAGMGPWTQRRAASEVLHDVFWITDSMGNYGFLIETKDVALSAKDTLNLKGIAVIKRIADRDMYEFILILNDKEEWRVFKALCRDLIEVIISHEDRRKMVAAIEDRLRQWQRLLQRRPAPLTIERQMGLFSELLCLRDVATKKERSVGHAISSWVGPDFDKQDFLMSAAVVEVKSYRTSGGESVKISSVDQLYCNKDPLYLLSYGLTPSASGISVAELSHDIKGLLDSEHLEDLFESKLWQYGYTHEDANGPLQGFVVDKIRVFKIVADFPRIVPTSIKSEITSVKYVIDLSHCGEFELDYNEFMVAEALS